MDFGQDAFPFKVPNLINKRIQDIAYGTTFIIIVAGNLY